MRFRDDIDPATTWIVSDTHFGHDNIVGYCHRPLDHDQLMIAEWRANVPDDHTVLHLGDLAYSSNARFKHIVAPELTGKRKLLIEGNHDRQRFRFYMDCGFRVVKPFALKIDGADPTGHGISVMAPNEPLTEMDFSVSFAHYPWNRKEEGEMPPNHLRVHGHIHNNGYTRDAYVPFLRNHVNLSVEQTKYRPVNMKALLDAVLLGTYPETTEEQLAEVRARKAERKK